MIRNPCFDCTRECPLRCKDYDDFISAVQDMIGRQKPDQFDVGKMVAAALFSSECENWGTPRPLYDLLSKMFGPFDLDPCTSSDNPLGTPTFYTKETDGLKQIWGLGTYDKPTRVFANPPYGSLVGTWIYKAWLASLYGRAVVVCLLPARTDTRWFHTYCMVADAIYFIKGRLTFEGADNTAPFPSMVVVFKAKPGAGPPHIFSLEAPKK